MRNSLQKVIAEVLPSLCNTQLSYNAEHNVFLTAGYTSVAGNTYYQAIRLSKNLLVEYNLGQGYLYTFLNAISLFTFNNNQRVLISRREWGPGSWMCFNEERAKGIAIDMLCDYVKSQAKSLGYSVDSKQALEFSKCAIEETQRKQIA